MSKRSLDSFGALKALTVGGKEYKYFSLPSLQETTGKSVERLPYSLRVLLENLLRNEDGVAVTREDIQAFLDWNPERQP